MILEDENNSYPMYLSLVSRVLTAHTDNANTNPSNLKYFSLHIIMQLCSSQVCSLLETFQLLRYNDWEAKN